MPTWYRTKSWSWEIVPIEIVAVTAKTVSFSNGRRADKTSANITFHPTREAALDYLRERLQRLRFQLTKAEAEFMATEASQ